LGIKENPIRLNIMWESNRVINNESRVLTMTSKLNCEPDMDCLNFYRSEAAEAVPVRVQHQTESVRVPVAAVVKVTRIEIVAAAPPQQ
jgi:hypothetical protein